MKRELSTVQLLCGSFTCLLYCKFVYSICGNFTTNCPIIQNIRLIFVFITLNMLQLEFTFSNRHWNIDFQDLLRQRSQPGISLQYCYNCVHRQYPFFNYKMRENSISWIFLKNEWVFWFWVFCFCAKIFCTNTHKLLPKVYSNMFSGNLKYSIGLWYDW